MERQCSLEDLSAFLDDELSSKKHIEVKQHLQGCHDCQSELARMRQCWDLMLEMPAPQVSGDFRARVWQAIEPRGVPALLRLAWLRRPQSVAAKVALAFGGFLLIWSVGIGAGTGLYARHRRSQTLFASVDRLTQMTLPNSIFEVYQRRQ